MKKTYIFAFSVLCAVSSLFNLAHAADGEKTSYALPFVAITRDAGQAGMAGAGSSAGGAFTALRNPAASAFAGASDVQTAYQSWAPKGSPSTNFNLGGSFAAGEKVGISVALGYQKGEAYDLVSTTGAATGQFTPSDLLIGVGAAYAVTPAVSLGVNAKIARQSLSDDDSYSSVALDLSAMYKVEDFRISAGTANLLGSIKDAAGKSFSLPASAFVAGDWSKALPGGSVCVAADVDYFLKGGVSAAFGAQYGIKDIVFLRAGYHVGTEGAPIPSYASVGLGARYAGVGLDFAYLLANDVMGGSLCVGLSYKF